VREDREEAVARPESSAACGSVSIHHAHEDLIGGEGHIPRACNGFDGLDLTIAWLQGTTKRVPPLSSLDDIRRSFSCDVRVFPIRNIEIIPWTDKHCGHKSRG
jgi:hypothetical protein